MEPTSQRTPMQFVFQRKWLFIFIGIMCVLLVVSAVLNAFTTPPPPAETVIPSTQKIGAAITFDQMTVQIPTKLNVYTSQLAPVDVKKFAAQLADGLKLSLSQEVEDHWVNKQTDEVVYLEDQNQYIAYSAVYVVNPFASLPKIPVEQAQEKTLSFIKDHNLLINVQVSSKKFVVISTEGFEPTEDEGIANGYQFSINKSIDNIPYFPDRLSDDIATAWTDLSGRIIKMRFAPVVLEEKIVNSHNTLSLENVENNMKAGLVTYIRTQPLIAQKDSSQEMVSVNFDHAFLEYRQNTLNGYILPYLRFTGVGKDTKQAEYYVEAISPAVKVE